MDEHRTAKYRKIIEKGGIRYLFFCDLSGALVCAVNAENPEAAWETGAKKQFSQCHHCGRWVSDPMYNAETWKCVQCSPWEEQPAFCPHCGKSVVEDEVFCHSCHTRLKYRETEECG